MVEVGLSRYPSLLHNVCFQPQDQPPISNPMKADFIKIEIAGKKVFPT
eukprot:CAMPEP_0206407610 /NCGR_PEP_ID=MMETSP0294-20121207/30610_1 /ASSEMBLY_ACC=CAM_ASM_000327 /TAXON_ID=39354 /ORGANISM="Heterosigma akashiwo, Strain CCMP2393" /LENGTH=47 /DNA_ID= /DNA_START= /DNA_END= /DNA_ORIENTATION=